MKKIASIFILLTVSLLYGYTVFADLQTSRIVLPIHAKNFVEQLMDVLQSVGIIFILSILVKIQIYYFFGLRSKKELLRLVRTILMSSILFGASIYLVTQNDLFVSLPLFIIPLVLLGSVTLIEVVTIKSFSSLSLKLLLLAGGIGNAIVAALPFFFF